MTCDAAPPSAAPHGPPHYPDYTPFDIRPKGYSYSEARTFLEDIGEQGRAYYANPELIIDTFYPPLYAVSRGLALWWLTMPGRVREAPVPLKVRYAQEPVFLYLRSFTAAARFFRQAPYENIEAIISELLSAHGHPFIAIGNRDRSFGAAKAKLSDETWHRWCCALWIAQK